MDVLLVITLEIETGALGLVTKTPEPPVIDVAELPKILYAIT